MTRLVLITAALSAGCGPGGEGSGGPPAPTFDTGDAPDDGPGPGEDGEPVEDPSAYEGPDDGDGESWDHAGATASLQAAVDSIRSWNAGPVGPAYGRAMRSASGDCPARTGSGGDDTWIARCSTGAGASFDGYAQVDAYTEQSEGGIRWTGTFWYLAAVIHTADGYTLGGGGAARLQTGVGTDGRSTYDAWYSFLQGTLTWDGPGSEGEWIVAEPTPNVSLQARSYRDSGQRVLVVEGSTTLSEGWLTAMSFDDLRITAGSDRNCEEEPSGGIDLRTPAGDWVTLSFDGGTCDGCGDVMVDDERIDELCADWSPLTSWGASPW